MVTLAVAAPESFAEAAAMLAAAGGDGHTVRIAGAETKRWGAATTPAPGELELRTTALDRILAHDAGDMTATLQAGVPLARAQRVFAQAGQMLALDPPTGPAEAATIGGIVASGDCGPLSHRYGAPRDLVVGATVALGDGTIARSGGTVIKNVAGYDLAKLFCGSFGTLGLILSVNVRLHPLPPRGATAIGASGDPDELAAAARGLAALPAELEALDVAWSDGAGAVLARCAGPQSPARAARLAEAMSAQGLQQVRIETDDAPLWERQRAGQRSTDQVVIRVAAPATDLAAVLRAAGTAAASVVGRAALGHSYVTLAPAAVAGLRGALPQRAATVLLDAPADARPQIADPWGRTPPAALALMRAVKVRFDPTGTCNPGGFVV